MKFSLIVLGLLVVGYAHWPWPLFNSSGNETA
jgi:hypothetical protein